MRTGHLAVTYDWTSCGTVTRLFYELTMKHVFLILFILGLGINVHAEEKQSIFFLYSMDHFQTEPQQIGISLFDSPKLKFSDGLLEISYNNNTLTTVQ